MPGTEKVLQTSGHSQRPRGAAFHHAMAGSLTQEMLLIHSSEDFSSNLVLKPQTPSKECKRSPPFLFIWNISKTKCIWKARMYCTEVCSPWAGSPSVTTEERKGMESQQVWSGRMDQSWGHRAAHLTELLQASLQDSLISRSSFLYYTTFYLTKSR